MIQNVIIYPRKSREDEQREKETGEDCLQTMTNLLVSTCERLGIKNYDVIPEIGSADTIDGRPVFSRIINELLPSGKYDSIAVREISRLGRGNFTDAGRIYEIITRYRVYIITPSRIYDPSNKADLRFIRMELFMAREEYELIRERLWYGKDERGKAGYAAGFLPVLGLKSHRGMFTLIPEELEILKRIFEMRANHVSFQAICDILNSEGVLSKKGKKWDPTTIWQITHNKRYIGIAKWNGQEFPAQHPPLIDIELWNRVQEANKERAVPKNRENSPYIIRLYCHECGNRMYGNTDSAKTKVNGKWRYYNYKPFYVCWGRRSHNCSHRVRAEKVHSVILAELHKLLETDTWNQLAEERSRIQKGENLGKVLKDKEKILKEKMSFLSKLDHDYMNGLSPALYSKHYEQTQNIINTLQHEISEIKKKVRERKSNKASPNQVKKQLIKILEKWDNLTYKRQKQIINTVFPRIEIAKNGEFYITRTLPDKL